jgi:acetyl/propionyl-CoA carboxylase alpha subunit
LDGAAQGMKTPDDVRSFAVRLPIRWIVVTVALVAAALSALLIAKYATEVQGLATTVVGRLHGPKLPAGFASGNGRIEATEYDIATKRPGRIAAVAVREGDMVAADQVLASMDTRDLEADLHDAVRGGRKSFHIDTTYCGCTRHVHQLRPGRSIVLTPERPVFHARCVD